MCWIFSNKLEILFNIIITLYTFLKYLLCYNWSAWDNIWTYSKHQSCLSIYIYNINLLSSIFKLPRGSILDWTNMVLYSWFLPSTLHSLRRIIEDWEGSQANYYLLLVGGNFWIEKTHKNCNLKRQKINLFCSQS